MHHALISSTLQTDESGIAALEHADVALVAQALKPRYHFTSYTGTILQGVVGPF